MYPTRGSLDRQLWEVRFLQRPTDDRCHVWQLQGNSGSVDLDVMPAGQLRRLRQAAAGSTDELTVGAGGQRTQSPRAERLAHLVYAARMEGPVQIVDLATGVTVPYVVQGDPSGVPVLLLHPWAESMGCFDRLRPLLPPSLWVLAWDQRGHGRADKPAGGYELSDLAADVVAFLDAFDLAAAVLAGSSSGGLWPSRSR